MPFGVPTTLPTLSLCRLMVRRGFSVGFNSGPHSGRRPGKTSTRSSVAKLSASMGQWASAAPYSNFISIGYVVALRCVALLCRAEALSAASRLISYRSEMELPLSKRLTSTCTSNAWICRLTQAAAHPDVLVCGRLQPRQKLSLCPRSAAVVRVTQG